MDSLIVKGLDLALAVETCLGQPQTSKTVKNSQAFPWEEKKTTDDRAVFEVLQGMSVEISAKTIEDLTCVCSTVSAKKQSYTKTKSFRGIA